MNSNGLLEKIEDAINKAKTGHISSKDHENNILALSEEVRVQSARLIGCGSYVYAGFINDALERLIKIKVMSPEPVTESKKSIFGAK
jgi:hypothetical protein